MTLKILAAQINSKVGAIQDNYNEIVKIILAHQDQFDLIVFPELALCGYPPEDLLLYNDFIDENLKALQRLQKISSKAKILLGFPRKHANQCFNSVALIDNHQLFYYDKRQLPNHSVFNESRYFHPGSSPFLTFVIKGHHFGVLICEDIWHPQHLLKLKTQNIETLISINASPYYQGKFEHRKILCQQPEFNHINHIYVNCVGGQDEILFDVQSFVMNGHGQMTATAAAFKPEVKAVVLAMLVKSTTIFGVARGVNGSSCHNSGV